MIAEFNQIADKFDEICRAVGLVQHDNVYSDENITEKNLKNTYMISIGEITVFSSTQNQHINIVPVNINVYSGPNRSNFEALKDCLAKGQEIIQKALHPEIRSHFMQVELDRFANEQMNDDNDNIIRGVINFNVWVPLVVV